MNNWISVKDRLPYHTQRILFYSMEFEDSGQPLHGIFYDWEDHSPEFKDTSYGGSAYDFGDITHWMPLPEAPKEYMK